MDYYHPAWKAVVSCFLANIIMAPALFMPREADAVLQLRLLLFLSSPFYTAILLYSYFGKVKKRDGWRTPLLALVVPFIALALTATVLAIVPGTQMDHAFRRWLFPVTGILALLLLAFLARACLPIIRELHLVAEENYSNPDDFPHGYATSAIWISVSHLCVSWTAALAGTTWALSIGLLGLSALAIIFLIGVLSPHRTLAVERLEMEPVSVRDTVLSQERQEEIERSIRLFVEDGQAYLDSHLSLADVCRGIGISRGYVSFVMNSRLGGFYPYINRCRYDHVARLKAEQPGTPIGELIVAAGFGSPSTYYSLRKHLNKE
jgi:AraC-like DNA-binding protein